MTITAFGSDAATAWANVEDIMRSSFYAVTPKYIDWDKSVGMQRILRESTKGIASDGKNLVLELAYTDFVDYETESWADPQWGYRLSIGDVGGPHEVIVVFARKPNDTQVRLPNGDLLPSLREPCGWIDPGCEFTAQDLLVRIGGAYRAYSKLGDRPTYRDPQVIAAEREEKMNAAVEDSPLGAFIRQAQPAPAPSAEGDLF